MSIEDVGKARVNRPKLALSLYSSCWNFVRFRAAWPNTRFSPNAIRPIMAAVSADGFFSVSVLILLGLVIYLHPFGCSG